MIVQRFNERCNDLKRMLHKKEKEIDREYLRFSVITTQKAEETNRVIDTLTKEIFALKQELYELESREPDYY